VVAGGLVGMMFGIRRSFVKKLLYGALGATGAAYVVYPKETVYYSQNGLSIAKKYSAVGYNFVFGGKFFRILWNVMDESAKIYKTRRHKQI
jgi:hypothetical protein